MHFFFTVGVGVLSLVFRLEEFIFPVADVALSVLPIEVVKDDLF